MFCIWQKHKQAYTCLYIYICSRYFACFSVIFTFLCPFTRKCGINGTVPHGPIIAVWLKSSTCIGIWLLRDKSFSPSMYLLLVGMSSFHWHLRVYCFLLCICMVIWILCIECICSLYKSEILFVTITTYAFIAMKVMFS